MTDLERVELAVRRVRDAMLKEYPQDQMLIKAFDLLADELKLAAGGVVWGKSYEVTA